MKCRLAIAVLTVLCVGLFCSLPALNQAQAQAKRAPVERMTVLSPMGTPPPIQRKSQAPRLDTLDGKTLYFVNTGYIGTDRLMAVMMDWFKANCPRTNVVYRVSKAGMTEVDKALWAEIGEKGDAVILGLGH